MNKQLLFLSGPLLFLISLLFISSSELYTTADFVGSEACKNCHPEKYNDWVASGHPYKFTVIENDEAPVYPLEAVNYMMKYLRNIMHLAVHVRNNRLLNITVRQLLLKMLILLQEIMTRSSYTTGLMTYMT